MKTCINTNDWMERKVAFICPNERHLRQLHHTAQREHIENIQLKTRPGIRETNRGRICLKIYIRRHNSMSGVSR